MAIYTIEANGQQFDIEGPDNATQDELQGAVDAHSSAGASAPQGQPNMVEKALGLPHAERRDPLAALNAFTSEMSNTGEQMTEALGKRGVPAPISAAVGMVPTFLPDAIASSIGGPELKLASKTKLGRMVTAPFLKTAGKQLGEAEAKAGINVLEESVNAPRTRKTIVSFANRLKKVVGQGADKLAETVDAKTLNQLKTETGDILDYLKVAKQGASPKQLVSKGTIARLSQIKDALVNAVGTAEPAVGEALKTYAASKGRQQALRTLGGAAKTVAKVAGGGALGYGALKGLFQ